MDHLLIAIENDQLVALVGAGLSMAPPSEVPTAAALAGICCDKYQTITGNPLPDPARAELEQIADHFLGTGDFEKVFLQCLIPWDKFRLNPNPGHEAIADFLACGVVQTVITTNFDTLVERAAERIGEIDFRAIVETQDINVGGTGHAPLLKLHSCETRDRRNTIWSRRQFGNAITVDRIAAFGQWLGGQLMGREIVILGYWTDWDYLNELLINAVRHHTPARVFLVNPSSPEQLKAKAPGLWDWANSEKVILEHLNMSASDFLQELRRRFSERYISRIVEGAAGTYQALSGKEYTGVSGLSPDLTLADLYELRRQFCGVPSNGIVRSKRPNVEQELVGAIHLLLIARGATMVGPVYHLSDKVFRLIQANGQVMSKLIARFSEEPPSQHPAEITICAGVLPDGGVPSHLVRRGESRGIVRPGVSGDWISGAEFVDQVGRAAS